jgi:FSR family fosmidomycin resistance protein-like MFS transporter
LVAFGAIHLNQRFEIDPVWRSLALGGWMLGTVLGSLLLQQLLRAHPPRRLLVALSALAGAATLGFAFAPTPGLAAGALFALGLFGTALHPLAAGQAFRALPGQSGTVVAMESALMPLELALPVLLGLAVDHWGSALALALLAAQPAYLAALTAFDRRLFGDDAVDPPG